MPCDLQRFPRLQLPFLWLPVCVSVRQSVCVRVWCVCVYVVFSHYRQVATQQRALKLGQVLLRLCCISMQRCCCYSASLLPFCVLHRRFTGILYVPQGDRQTDKRADRRTDRQSQFACLFALFTRSLAIHLHTRTHWRAKYVPRVCVCVSACVRGRL